MPSTSRVTILLADEDALRRDGLSAVLAGNENFEVVARVPDGEAALESIRDRRPDIAIVDLNLPRLHGIELIRRVRSEQLRTRIVVLAGTTDDEIIREVVRAGGDGYLLKNGPARHLIDAISYVRDGGQYFSPQLHRDGRDRHLLEEPPRSPAADLGDTQADPEGRDGGESEPVDRPRRSPSSRPRRNGRRSNDPQQFREKIRAQSGASQLDDRDYEIMSMMADGIRPILDRLDEIDNRVAQMEEGDEPVPANPRGWLTRQLADTLNDGPGSDIALSRTAGELEARLPEMIEEAVTRRFNQMAGKLQQEIEESHVRTLETFVKNIQVKLVQRVSALEQDMSKQAEAMHQLREYSQRTEDNLSRLISGVDKLAQELPKRLAAAQQEKAEFDRRTAEAPAPETPRPSASTPLPRKPRVAPRNVPDAPPHSNRIPKIFWSLVAGFLLVGLLAWGAAKFASSRSSSPSTTPAAATGSGKPAPPAASADTKTKLLAAQQYSDRKDYALAEDIYKQVVAAEPDNVEALKGLASVLYREDKVDESAAILDRIPKN
jgi:DNA-binding NarL/FixJ family response regulator